jgi:molybdenum cofactor cytidylyltransferase
MNVAVILAAGESRRMGRPKQLLPFGDSTMLECVIRAFESPLIEQRLVVLGHRAGEIARRLGRVNATIVANKHYKRGMFSSVQAGLRALPAGTKRVLVALGDQPRLQRTTVEGLLRQFVRGRHKILIPTYNGRQGHPLLFAARYVPEILAMEQSQTLRHFLANHPREIARVPVEDEGVVVDIDEPATYERQLRSL